MYAIAKEMPEIGTSIGRYMMALMRATNREMAEFADSCLIAGQTAMRASRENPLSVWETVQVMQHNQALITKGMMSAQEKMLSYVFDQIEEGTQALVNSVYNGHSEGERLGSFLRREADVMESVANFNEQIEKIKDEFGFHFNTSDYKLVHETDTFHMYQVLPLKKGVQVRKRRPADAAGAAVHAGRAHSLVPAAREQELRALVRQRGHSDLRARRQGHHEDRGGAADDARRRLPADARAVHQAEGDPRQEGGAERHLPGRLHLPDEHPVGQADRRLRHADHQRHADRRHLLGRDQRHAADAQRLHHHVASEWQQGRERLHAEPRHEVRRHRPRNAAGEGARSGVDAPGDRAQPRQDAGGAVPLAAEGAGAPAARSRRR